MQQVQLAPVDEASGLAGQPLDAGTSPAGAVAAAALLHYLGVNSGCGGGPATGPVGVAQDVCSQWLEVYAGLHVAAPGSVGMHTVQGSAHPRLVPVTSARALGEALCDGSLHCNHLPTPSALLGWLADWVGSVLPGSAVYQGHRGVFDGEVAPLLPTVARLRPQGDALSEAQACGGRLKGRALASALSAILDTAVLWCEVPTDTPTVTVPRQCPFRGGSGFPVCPSAHIAGVDEHVRVPCEVPIRLPGVPPDQLMAALLRGAVMAVAHGPGAGALTVVVSNTSDEPVLLEAVATAAAITMVQAVRARLEGGAGAGAGVGSAGLSPGCERGLLAALVGVLPHAGVDVACRAVGAAFVPVLPPKD
jgi:hypothetical protein